MSERPPNRHVRSLFGLALAAVVFAGVWFVFDHLRRAAALEHDRQRWNHTTA